MKKMKNLRFWFWLILIFILVEPGCRSQDQKTLPPAVDRPTAVAGSFYPGDSSGLRSTLRELFSKAKPAAVKDVVAMICPHAGYEFSGIVAASGYRQIDPDKQYDNIFIIGSSHRASFMGASVYSIGDYLTPLGKVKVNRELANKLIRENAVFTFNPEADKAEHSIEVQLPFLQYYLKKSFNLVPIVLGTQSVQSCKKVAMALKPYLGGNNLFVISSDFSHYPSYNEAIALDKNTCDAILSGKPDQLVKILKANNDQEVSNLATSLCGWTSVLTLMYMTESDPGITMTPIYYQNSGDSKYRDRSQVVGYWSIVLSGKTAQPSSTDFQLSTRDKKDLLKIARNTIEQYIRNGKTPEVDATGFSELLKTEGGAFVTLTEDGVLRGCVGQFYAQEPLYLVVRDMAIASSTQDNRFPPVKSNEIDKLEIEISVLSPLKLIKSIDEIVLGKHGIYIRKGYQSGTFLPQVASGTGWSKEEFLGHCARDKAGIGWNGWKDAEIYTYEAAVFSEKELSGHKD